MIQLLTPPVVAAGDDRVIAAALDGQLHTIVAKINELITALGVARGTDSLIADGSLRWRMAGERLRTSIDEIARMIEPIRQVFQPDDLQYALDGKTVQSIISDDGQVFFATTYADKSASFTIDGPPEILYRVKVRLRTMAEDTAETSGTYRKQHPFTNEQDGGVPLTTFGDPIEMLVSSPLVGAVLNTGPSLIPTIISVNTTKTSTGSTSSTRFKLPLRSIGTYSFVVDWGDGSPDDVITAWNDTATTHTYAIPGTYTVKITGQCLGWAFANTGDRLKLVGILQWGTSVQFNNTNAFQGCATLTNIVAVDEPSVVPGSNIGGMFLSCTGLLNIPGALWPNFSKWAIGMSNMLQNDSALEDTFGIGNWDVSDVQLMNSMFYNCTKFEGPLTTWDVGNVTEAGFMLRGTGGGAGGSHPPLDLTGWNISKMIRLDGFLEAATWGAINFAGWDISKVTTLEKFMYLCAYSPTLDSSGWDTSAVTNMSQVFKQASLFNSSVDHWNTANVTTMLETFRAATVFNQSLASWNVEKVTTMFGMFRDSPAFKQNLGAWWPKSCGNLANFLRGGDINAPNSATSRANYDALLVGWTDWSGSAGAKGLALQSGVVFDGGSSKYSAGSPAAAARAWLVATKGWTINDGGPL